MLRGMERADLVDAVHSLPRLVDWPVRSSLARRLGVGSAVDVVDVAVFGDSVAHGSLVFYFGKVFVIARTSLPSPAIGLWDTCPLDYQQSIFPYFGGIWIMDLQSMTAVCH